MVASYKVGDSVLVDGQIVDVFPGTGTYLVNVGIASCGGIGPDRLRPMNSARHVAPPESVTLTEEIPFDSEGWWSFVDAIQGCFSGYDGVREGDPVSVVGSWLTENGFELRRVAEGGKCQTCKGAGVIPTGVTYFDIDQFGGCPDCEGSGNER